MPDPAQRTNRQYLAVYLSTGISAFAMNFASLHGVDFKVLGIPSEVVKAMIESHMVLFFMWVSADHIVDSITGGIIWMRRAGRKIWGAFTQPITDMIKKPD